MKIMKKTMALVLTFVMALAMCVTAFADDSTQTYTITAPNTDHQYEIYQIFTGDLSNGKLSNVKWGENGTGTKGEAVPEATLETIKAISGSDQQKAEALDDYANLTSTPVVTITNGEKYTAAAGYYLIKDKDGSVTGEDAYTTYLVKVVGDVTITPKSDVPSFEKKIKDTNDTTGVVEGWQDSADYDIGDDVPFQLKGTVASNYAAYDTYYFAFHDKAEASLTFDADSVKVYIDGKEVSTGYEVETTGISDGCTFEVVFSDLKQTAAHADSEITVEYTAKLNENAVLGSQGNVNEAKLVFSNNPNNSQGGDNDDHGETPWDNVIVFTYKVVVNKVDSENKALAGAAFKLEKEIKGVDGAENTWEEVDSFTAGEATSFTFKGLDDGNYRLTETATPAGYNSINPITFTVTAAHKVEWTSEERNTILTNLSGNAASGEITFTPSIPDGSLSTDVVNKSGAELPSTGGIGTTIFYVFGTILVAGAAVLMITKKRMHA